jgi:hypothetical protein
MNIEALARDAVEACGGAYGDVVHVAKILALVRAQALEEAAKVRESVSSSGAMLGGEDAHALVCADAIRALVKPPA